MIRATWTLFRKDIMLSLARGTGLFQALLLGLLLIFLFSLSAAPGERITPKGAAALFWMASVFCQVLVFSTLYSYEETNGQRQGLLLSDAPIQAVWIGKGLAALSMLCLAQLVFFPALVVFLHQSPNEFLPSALVGTLLVNIGSVSIGSLLGALSQGRTTKESLLSIILFPLLVPVLLAGISLMAAAFGAPGAEENVSWLRLAAAFDAIFCGAAYILFPFMYTAET